MVVIYGLYCNFVVNESSAAKARKTTKFIYAYIALTGFITIIMIVNLLVTFLIGLCKLMKKVVFKKK